jgi:spore maturation protein CgeB
LGSPSLLRGETVTQRYGAVFFAGLGTRGHQVIFFERLGARLVRPLYGSVDPDVHRPARPQAAFEADPSYLGTYAEDRQDALHALFLEPARRRSDLRFVIGGSMYPPSFTWAPNIHYVTHVPPHDHPSFFSSSRLTLNVTRAAMAARCADSDRLVGRP